MRRQQRQGAAGEQAAALVLKSLGVGMVERIATPVRLIPSGRNDGTFRVVYGEPVSGDFRGIMPDGRSVLIECKTTDGNLMWGHLREHQPGRLQEHCEHGGLSLLVWVTGMDVFVMEWPVWGFGPRKSITATQAQAVDLLTRKMLDEYSSNP